MDFNVTHPPISPKQEVRRILVASAIGLLMGLLIVAIVLVSTGDDPRDESTPPAPPSTVWSGTMGASPPLTQITEAAEVTLAPPVVARGPQIQLTEPEPPPFDPVFYVNSLDYRAVVPEPAMEAYRVVATWYGWSPETVEARATFAYQIMGGESAYCWNARRWTYFRAGDRCIDHKTGVHDDVGFGQVTSVLRPLTCEKAGLCDIATTVASPWNSMLSFVVVMDELGKRPWCYLNNTHIRNGDCATWPG